VQKCFCQTSTNFDNFWQKDAKGATLIFPISPNLRHHTTVLNADVPNWYITLKLLVLDCSRLHHQFDKGRHVVQFSGNSHIFDKYSLRPLGYHKERRRRKPSRGVKVNGKYYHNNLHGQKLLADIRPLNQNEIFVFQQDGVPHIEHATPSLSWSDRRPTSYLRHRGLRIRRTLTRSTIQCLECSAGESLPLQNS